MEPWQVKQVSESRAVLSWDLGDRKSCTEWQLVQATPRRSWAEPVQVALWVFSWQPWQVLLTSAAFIFLSDRMGPGSLVSWTDFRCPVTSPWHAAQLWATPAWGVVAMWWTDFSWQAAQSSGLQPAAAGEAAGGEGDGSCACTRAAGAASAHSKATSTSDAAISPVLRALMHTSSPSVRLGT